MVETLTKIPVVSLQIWGKLRRTIAWALVQNHKQGLHNSKQEFHRTVRWCLLSLPSCLCGLYLLQSRSQWPPGLRRRSAAARLLRLWVRIPPEAWMIVCCVLSGTGLCDGLITRSEESYRRWCVVVWFRNLVNEETLAHWGRLPQKQTYLLERGCSRDIILLRWTFRLIRSQNICEVNTNERIMKNRRDCIRSARSVLSGIKTFMFIGLKVMYRRW